MRPGVTRGAVYLRHATQRIRVLHPAAVDMTLHDGAVVQQEPQPLRYQQVPRIGTQPVQPFIKGRLGTRKRLQAHGADDIGSLETEMQPLYAFDREGQDELPERPLQLGAAATHAAAVGGRQIHLAYRSA